MADTLLPTSKSVRDLLSDLFGREVEVAERAVLDPELHPGSSVGVYRDDAKNTAAVVTADLALSVYLAAALGLTSKEAADEAVSTGALSDSYAENLHEILNIISGLFNAPGRRHVALHAVHGPGESLVPRVSTFATAVGSRLDLTVSVPGYGSGAMALVV
jgi:hypothetical protein